MFKRITISGRDHLSGPNTMILTPIYPKNITRLQAPKWTWESQERKTCRISNKGNGFATHYYYGYITVRSQ